jgi:hypothetical protein
MKQKRKFKFRAMRYKAVGGGSMFKGPWRASYGKARADFDDSVKQTSTSGFSEGCFYGHIEIDEVTNDEVFFYGVFISLTEIGVKKEIKQDPDQ